MEGAINSQLQRSLVAVNLPTDFFTWLLKVQEVAWRVENLESKAHQPRHGHPAQHPGRRRDAEGDTAITGVNRVQGTPKDRAARPPQPSSRYCCYVCGSAEYIARDCPDRHADSRVAVVNTPARDKKVADELWDSDDSSSDEEPENE